MSIEVNFNNNPNDMRLVPGKLIPEPSCGSCIHYDGGHCTKDWNNLDDAYYIPERDDKDSCECCDDYDWDEDLTREEHPQYDLKQEG